MSQHQAENAVHHLELDVEIEKPDRDKDDRHHHWRDHDGEKSRAQAGCAVGQTVGCQRANRCGNKNG